MDLDQWLIEPAEDGSGDVFLTSLRGAGQCVRVQSPVDMGILMRLIERRSAPDPRPTETPDGTPITWLAASGMDPEVRSYGKDGNAPGTSGKLVAVLLVDGTVRWVT